MSKQTVVSTFWARIYCGLWAGYSDVIRSAEQAESVCREYADAVGLCVTVTSTTFVYRDGTEPGVIVGLINYPRFQSTRGELRERALELAEQLREDFEQIRVSVVMPDETVMIGAVE